MSGRSVRGVMTGDVATAGEDPAGRLLPWWRRYAGRARPAGYPCA